MTSAALLLSLALFAMPIPSLSQAAKGQATDCDRMSSQRCRSSGARRASGDRGRPRATLPREPFSRRAGAAAAPSRNAAANQSADSALTALLTIPITALLPHPPPRSSGENQAGWIACARRVVRDMRRAEETRRRPLIRNSVTRVLREPPTVQKPTSRLLHGRRPDPAVQLRIGGKK